ncbi:MAG: hypothetical protein J7494_09365 [Sphingobium sp.]|nr:hypothetical protein [Sphingobium sp.]
MTTSRSKMLMTCLLAGLLASPSRAADYQIFDGSKIDAMLAQCSRGTPQRGQGSWQPSPRDIAAFEAALPSALARANTGDDWSGFPRRWIRQYVGLVRNGRRYIYGNFALADLDGRKWRQPVMVCDGGHSFFGAEYDVREKKISHLAFNGYT